MNLLLTIFFVLFSGIGLAKPLNNIVVFGDSLSDNGNLYEYMQHRIPNSPPYFEGRFSNGPVWVEYLAESAFPGNEATHLFDYAFGGAAVVESVDEDALFTLKREVDAYLIAHHNQADPLSLFVVWIGANNYLALSDSVEKTVHDVNKGIRKELERLEHAGARHVLVLNLPDLGNTPAAKEIDKQTELTAYTRLHNATLAKSIESLQNLYPHVQWVAFDTDSLFRDLLDSPETYGFTNTTGTCYDILVDKTFRQSVLTMVSNINLKSRDERCDDYLFFDPIHSTSIAHKLLAEKVRAQLDAAGIEFAN